MSLATSSAKRAAFAAASRPSSLGAERGGAGKGGLKPRGTSASTAGGGLQAALAQLSGFASQGLELAGLAGTVAPLISGLTGGRSTKAGLPALVPTIALQE